MAITYKQYKQGSAPIKTLLGPISYKDYIRNKNKEEKDEPLPTIKDRSLKVDDIVNTTQYVEKIRDYMVDKKRQAVPIYG